MKNLLTILLLATSLAVSAQSTYTAPAPVYIIDSVEMNTPKLKQAVKFIAGNQIKSVNVVKNNKYPNGAVFMTLTDNTLLPQLLKDKILSLNEIAGLHLTGSDKNKKPVFLVDDQLITDTTDIFIPSIFLRDVKVLTTAQAPYFSQAFPNAVVIKISTKEPVIYIKGTAD